MNRSRIPNASLLPSVVLNCALVKKFAWLARSDGIARIRRNIAISTIATMIVEPASGGDRLEQSVARAAP